MPQTRPSRWEIERELERIWKDALDLPSVKRSDDFFSLGGDSVAATKVVTAIEEVFSNKLPMSALVENPTVGMLACRIESEVAQDEDDAMLVPIRMIGSRPPLFLVHGLTGQVVFAHILGRFIGEDQPLYAIRAQGFDGQPPLNDVPTMAEEYLALIRSVQPHGPYFLGGNCSGTFIAIEMGRMLLAAGEEVELMAAIDPLDPGMSFTQWRLKLGTLAPGDERSDAFRGNLRQRLESEIYGRGGIGRQRMEWAIDVGAALDLAIANHHPALYPGLITVLASTEPARAILNPAMPWRKLAAVGGMQVHVVSERHLALFLDNGPQIASLIRKSMDGITVKGSDANPSRPTQS